MSGPQRTWKSLGRDLLPLWIAAALFVANNLTLVGGWLADVEGYVVTGFIRGSDIFQYLTWARGFETLGRLPNYHAPWQTEPGMLSPFFWIFARLRTTLQIHEALLYHLLHISFYVVAVYALRALLRSCTDSSKQAWLAVAAMVCSVPLASLDFLPGLVRGEPMNGFAAFVWRTSDGLLHGINTSVLVTFGTATLLLAFVFLARYLQRGRSRDLHWAAAVGFVSAACHPFEIFVIVTAGATALAVASRSDPRRAVYEILILGVPAALGLVVYALQIWRFDWLADVGAQNVWHPGWPPRLLRSLGLPTLLALALSIGRPRLGSRTDVLLQAWVGWTLVGLYLPFVPWSQHLLDGYHCGVGLLVARRLGQSPWTMRLYRAQPKLVSATGGLVLALSLAAYLGYYHQAFLDGGRSKPEVIFTALHPVEEVQTVGWMRKNAKPSDLVLAPHPYAQALAAVPMHSFASHWLLSGTFDEQVQHSLAFYGGKLTRRDALAFLRHYGMRFVIVRSGSPAQAYLEGREPRTIIGPLTIYEFPEARMVPYAERKPFRPADAALPKS